MIPDRQVERMIAQARADHGSIVPCGKCKTFFQCFEQYPMIAAVAFFYNTPGSPSTHVVVEYGKARLIDYPPIRQPIR
jgi:hypothetical protein